MLRELLAGSGLRFKDAKKHPLAYRELKGYMRLFLLETAKNFGTASMLTAESALECVELIMEYQHYCHHTYENWVDFLYRFVMGDFGKVYNNLCVQTITAAYSTYACGETPENWRDGFNHKFGEAITDAKNATALAATEVREIWENKFKEAGL